MQASLGNDMPREGRAGGSGCCYNGQEATDAPGLRSPETYSDQKTEEMVLGLPQLEIVVKKSHL